MQRQQRVLLDENDFVESNGVAARAAESPLTSKPGASSLLHSFHSFIHSLTRSITELPLANM
jgi:hypothetical protein